MKYVKIGAENKLTEKQTNKVVRKMADTETSKHLKRRIKNENC